MAGAWSIPRASISGLGCAAVSRPFRISACVGRRAELGDGPLAERAARRRAARPSRRDACASSIATSRSSSTSGVIGFVDGYVLDRAMSPREAIEPLAYAFAFDASFPAARCASSRRPRQPSVTLGDDDLVPDKDGRSSRCARAQENELPHETRVVFCDSDIDYATAPVLSRRLEGYSSARSEAQSAVMTRSRSVRSSLADVWLQDIWAGRETARIQLRPVSSRLRRATLSRSVNAPARLLSQITRIADGAERAIEARAVDPRVFDSRAAAVCRRVDSFRPADRAAACRRARSRDRAGRRDRPVAYVAASPILGRARSRSGVRSAAVFEPLGLPRSARRSARRSMRSRPARSGASIADQRDGEALFLATRLRGDSSRSGRSAMAIRGEDGAWEIFAFSDAELVANDTYRLSRLLRGIRRRGGAREAQRARGRERRPARRCDRALAFDVSSIGANADQRRAGRSRAARPMSVSARRLASRCFPIRRSGPCAADGGGGRDLVHPAGPHRCRRMGALRHSARRRQRNL